MRTIGLIFFFIPFHLIAQDSTVYSQFRFTVIDMFGKQMTPEVITAKVDEVFYTDTSKQGLDYVFTKLDYSVKDSCWVLHQDDPFGYNYRIDIYRNSDTIDRAFLEKRKMTIIYKGYDPDDKSGCLNCICNDIPFAAGAFTIDIPKRIESWMYIRSLEINVKNKPVEFKDISPIQNWMFREVK